MNWESMSHSYRKKSLILHFRTFDEYSSEVQSMKLEWSPPHQSEQFWKQNASKLADNQAELVKYNLFIDISIDCLSKLLQNPKIMSSLQLLPMI
jgi:hypothetical protein